RELVHAEGHRRLPCRGAGRPQMITRRTFVVGAAASPTILRGASFTASRTVGTTAGPVRGSTEGGLQVFRGIRYGTGERFRAPVPPKPSGRVIEALSFGPSAPQKNDRYRPQSEDCLFLNVWTPEARRGANLPVMVYIHGGAYS